MKVQIPYGDKKIEFNIEEENFAGTLDVKEWPPAENERNVIRNAIKNPIGTARLIHKVKPTDKVVIVINDITRPTPSKVLIEEIVEELQEAGVKDQQIKLVVATGSHRPNNKEELKQMVGENIVERFEIENHKCEEPHTLTYIGDTPSGLPLHINKTVVEADVKILTGVIVPHHTAGYSGGRKSILPGVAGLSTLKLHHSLPIRPFNPSMGIMHNNPFHHESVFAARKVGVDFIVNVVQNSKKQTVDAVAGDLEQAHEIGVNLSEKICSTKIKKNYDIVITSPGGYPKDINLYQAQKSISPAEVLVKEGGIIILVAECRDPIEANDFPLWLKSAKTPMEVVERFKKEGFAVGSNKAFMIARALLKCKIIVVTDKLSEEELASMFLIRALNLDEAMEKAEEILGRSGETIVLPSANNVIPIMEV